MGLPVIQLKTDSYTFPDGTTLQYRELSRAEALQVGMIGPKPDAIEYTVIAFATGVTLEEAEAWIKATPQAIVRDFFDTIKEASGLGEEVGKDVDGGSPSEK
jgi:hypothetical protein